MTNPGIVKALRGFLCPSLGSAHPVDVAAVRSRQTVNGARFKAMAGAGSFAYGARGVISVQP